MVKANNSGQEAVEFILITALVFFGALTTITIFGNKVSAFFTSDSAMAKTANASAKVINASYNQQFKPDYETSVDYPPTDPNALTTDTTPNPVPVSNFDMLSYNIQMNEDGSASFNIKGQDIMLNPTTVEDLNIVFETTGSSGITEEVIRAIEKLITNNADKYGPGEVPINMSFGEGKRARLSVGHYEGTATKNMVTLTAGDDMILVQKDQNTFTCSGVPMSINEEESIQVIEGKVDTSKKTFTGTISSNEGVLDGKTYSTSFSTSGSVMSFAERKLVDDQTIWWSFQFDNNPTPI